MNENPLASIVQPGDPIRFWTPETGLTTQYGRVYALFSTQEGIPYAEIIPDARPEHHKYLCYHAVWGFALIERERVH